MTAFQIRTSYCFAVWIPAARGLRGSAPGKESLQGIEWGGGGVAVGLACTWCFQGKQLDLGWVFMGALVTLGALEVPVSGNTGKAIVVESPDPVYRQFLFLSLPPPTHPPPANGSIFSLS